MHDDLHVVRWVFFKCLSASLQPNLIFQVAWARDLVFGVLLQVAEMLTATMGMVIPSLDTAGASTTWLAGLSSNLPSKKKLAHGAVLGIRLAMQILRGTCDLWPDERSNEELKLRQLPSNLKIAGDTAKVIFDWLSTVLLSAFKILAAQEQYGSVAPTSGKLDPIDVSRVMRKLLKCVAELIAAFSDTHPSSLRLFPSLRRLACLAFISYGVPANPSMRLGGLRFGSSHYVKGLRLHLHPYPARRGRPPSAYFLRLMNIDSFLARRRMLFSHI